MMKILLTTAAAALLATSATAVMAGTVVPAPADPVVAAPVSAPAPVSSGDWSGFYFGASGGWVSGATTDLDTGDFQGLSYGGFLGYNYELNNGFVLGGEVAASMGALEWDGDENDTSDASFVDLKVRAGFAVDRALIYAFGGYSIADFGNDENGAGFNAGGGVDFLITDNIFAGVEYIYRDIEDSDGDPAAWARQPGTIQARVGIKF